MWFLIGVDVWRRRGLYATASTELDFQLSIHLRSIGGDDYHSICIENVNAGRSGEIVLYAMSVTQNICLKLQLMTPIYCFSKRDLIHNEVSRCRIKHWVSAG